MDFKDVILMFGILKKKFGKAAKRRVRMVNVGDQFLVLSLLKITKFRARFF